jgi:hypothetical protein
MPPSLLFTFRENSSDTEHTNTKPASQNDLTKSSTEVPIDRQTLPDSQDLTNRNGCNANKQNQKNKERGLEKNSTKLKGQGKEMEAMHTTARNKMQGFQKYRPPSRQKIRNKVAHSRYERKNRQS